MNKSVASFDGVRYCNKHWLRMYNNGDLEIHSRCKTTKLEYDGGDAATIVTAKGDRILIDSSDIEKAMKYSWCISKTGYAVANVSGKVTKMHRYLLGLGNGQVGGMVVDHINGNRLDNRHSNLRVCSAKDNARNTKKQISLSGETGVRMTARGKWNARIMVDRKEIYIGDYDTKEAAVVARRDAEHKYFGEYAASVSRQEDA